MSERIRARAGKGDRGAVLPIMALSLVVLMVMTAFSVDIGRQILRRREAQAVADVVALDMARQVDGRTRSEIESDPQWDQTRRDAAARNDFPVDQVTAVLGDWNPYTQVFTPSALTDVPDSVQVNAFDDVPFYFARVIGIDKGSVARDAVATQLGPCVGECCVVLPCDDPPDSSFPRPGTQAEGELGSVFAGFQFYAEPSVNAEYNLAAELRARVLNSTIFTQFGMSGAAGTAAPPIGLNLDALSYKGIANGFVRLGDLAAVLGFGSVDALLDATLTARDFFDANVTALRNSSSAADVGAGNKLASFAGAASSSLTLQLRDFIYVAQGQGDRAANFRLNALNLITSAGQVIDGKNFFSTTISTSIPGVASVPIRVAIIQPPVKARNFEGSGPCTDADYEALRQSNTPLPLGCGPRTSQVRVAADIPIELDLTPYGIPLVQETTIPVVFEAAAAQSFFTTVRCSVPTSDSKTNFRVVTNGVAMTIGSVSDASLQSTTTMSVEASALLTGSVTIPAIPPLPSLSIDLDSATEVSVSKTFKNGAVYNGQSATNAGVLGADETHLFVGNTVDNMIPSSWRYAGGVGNTNIASTMFNALGISNDILNSAVASALTAQLGNLDELLMNPTLSSLGITLAGADGAIREVDCNVRLVQ